MNILDKRRFKRSGMGGAFMVSVVFLFSLFILMLPGLVYSAGPDAPDRLSGVKPVPLIADPNVNMIRIPPPAEFLHRDLSAQLASTVTINYLPAGPGRYGDECIAWPSEPKAAFTYAASIWGSLLTSAVPIVIDACWATNLPTGVLGHSGSLNFFRDYGTFPYAGTWYSSSLANKLNGSDIDPATADMYIAYSNVFPWYYGTDGATPADNYDFVSVVLHEIAHGLGFAGSMTVTSGEGSWGYDTGYPVIYDRFTQNGSGQSLINTALFPNPSAALGTQLTGDNLYFNGTKAKEANGGSAPKIYAPSTWRGGSSYSHLDYTTFKDTDNALMVYAIGKGESRHSPGPVTMGLFGDVGWTTSITSTTSTLTVTIGGNKKGSVSATGLSCSSTTNTCTGTYTTGTSVAITASPKTGSVLDQWTGCDSVTSGTCNVTMTSNKSVTATFNTPPIIVVTPAALSFGTIRKEADPQPTKTVTVKNVGAARLILSSVYLSGTDSGQFSGYTTNCTTPLTKGGTPCTITIYPAPTSYGSKSAKLNIASNVEKKPVSTVNLTANVAPPKISVTPASLVFSGKVGVTTAEKKITVKNTGTSDLILSKLLFRVGTGSFSGRNDDCTGTLLKNKSCSLYVKFTAGAIGKVEDYVDVYSNDSTKNPASVKLTGTGR